MILSLYRINRIGKKRKIVYKKQREWVHKNGSKRVDSQWRLSDEQSPPHISLQSVHYLLLTSRGDENQAPAYRYDHVTRWLALERLKPGNVHMRFSSRSGYRPLTFRYNSMLNFIQVSFCFLLFLWLGLGLGLWSVIGLGFKVRVRGSASGSIT